MSKKHEKPEGLDGVPTPGKPMEEVVNDKGLEMNSKGHYNGGKRPGAGRPKGSRNIYSKDSVKRLEELSFDPIEMMVAKYWEIEEVIQHMNSGLKRYSAQAESQLIMTQQKIINDLMRYGYRMVPDKQEVEVEEKQPIAINLTGLAAKKDKDDK